MKIVEKLYRRSLFTRNDNPNGMFYFSVADFPGLQAEPYAFSSQMGHRLEGFFYAYPNPCPDRLVVFDHGLGNGHGAYLREIERLARGGYLVFAYDHTGCMASGGESTNGFSQSLKDLDDCITALKREPMLHFRRISVIGHSWGGFSVMNIPALHPEIDHVIAMSGFVSVQRMLEQVLVGPLKLFRRQLLELERRTNPGYADRDAAESLGAARAKVLLIASSNDPVVRPDYHHEYLKRTLSQCAHIRFLTTLEKGHNPTFTCEAVRQKDACMSEFKKLVRKKKLETARQQKEFTDRFDWWQLTQQDEAVWKEILDTLQS